MSDGQGTARGGLVSRWVCGSWSPLSERASLEDVRNDGRAQPRGLQLLFGTCARLLARARQASPRGLDSSRVSPGEVIQRPQPPSGCVRAVGLQAWLGSDTDRSTQRRPASAGRGSSPHCSGSVRFGGEDRQACGTSLQAPSRRPRFREMNPPQLALPSPLVAVLLLPDEAGREPIRP